MGWPSKWDYETDVAVLGYGGAGAVTAITAHDLGARVLLIEKQAADTPEQIRHTPSSRMSGGFFLCATDGQKAAQYLFWSSWGATPEDCCRVMGEYMVSNEAYMTSLGGQVARAEGFNGMCEYGDLAPGADAIYMLHHAGNGPGQFKVLMDNVDRRQIPVLYAHRGNELIQDPQSREILGLVAENNGQKVYIKAAKAVVLSTGGFEWNEEMKLNYLRTHPTYFYCNPANEGDGIKMGQRAGADLWHMNTISGRVIPYIQGVMPALGANFLTPFILVDKYGKRFATEPGDPDPARYRSHGFWLECTQFDSRNAEYPRIPCYQIFDETTRRKGPVARSMRRGLLPDGRVQYFYEWSRDNRAEIHKGWIIQADSIKELARRIAARDPENNHRMNPGLLGRTVTRFNRYCRSGLDHDFNRSLASLVPLEKPPFYALKLHPGGPNTNGGLKKNARGQVLDPDGKVIQRLYAPGENGSYFGFLYSGGGNLCENLVWGRVTGENAAGETSRG
ncbi:MAG: FAD-binding protein [Dehalococcoidia bacterium]|nr:FAD-binding protein [Desulfobacterales bacterium]MDZ4247115.1 FAD-binding protein [Dehalococcoidia bacterium]